MTLEQRLAPLKGHLDAHLLMGSAALGTHARLNVLTLLAEVAFCRPNESKPRRGPYIPIAW